MKHTYLKLLLRGVRKTGTRFISIMAIVAVGVSFLSGLVATSPDMEMTADVMYNSANMFDVNVKGTLGLTEDDLAAISSYDYVENVMPARVTDVIMSTEGGNSVTRIYGVPMDNQGSNMISRFELLEGRFPENKNECLLAPVHMYGTPHEIGEVYIISNENKNYDDRSDTYAFTELTVVGLVNSPMYMSGEPEPSMTGSGMVSLLMFVLPESYALDVYTDIFLTISGASEVDSFSEKYSEMIEDTTARLEMLGINQSEIRTAQVKNEAQAELDDAKMEYEDAKTEAEEKLADARQELDDGWAELEDGKAELEEKKQELIDGQTELDNGVNTLITTVSNQKAGLYTRIETAGQSQYDALLAEIEAQEEAALAQIALAQSQLDTQRAVLEEQERQLAEAEAAGYPVSEEEKAILAAGKAQIAAAQSEIDAQSAVLAAQISEGKTQLDTGFRTEINNQYSLAMGTINTAASGAWTEIGSSQEKIDDGWEQIAEAEQEIADAEIELEDGETEYKEGKEEAEAELLDAQIKIDDAQAQIDDIEDAEWYLSSREDNVSFSSYKGNMDKLGAIAKVFPGFFFLVAALVALTTMTRMVEEERTQIGTLKALGYSNGTIMFYYIGYSVLASLVGTLIGLFVGFKALPLLIANAYGMLYRMPPVMMPFRWELATFIIPLGVGCTTVATLSACLSQLRERPSSLMLPVAPKAGKRVLLERIGIIWKRISFTWKVTMRNIFRYKKRLFMTVFGVAGCCALLLTGFGLQNSIQDIVRLQFEEVYKYNMSIYLKETDAVSDSVVADFLADGGKVESYCMVHVEPATVETANGSGKTTLNVPLNTQEFAEQVSLRERKGGAELSLDDGDIVLTEKLCATLGIKLGDTVTVINSDGKAMPFKVSGITESYVTSSIYMNSQSYIEKYGTDIGYRLALIRILDESQDSRNETSKTLLDSSDVLAVQFSQNIRESFSNSVGSINYIVVVLIFAAGLLAVVVLYNLTNINISERRKELATIRVLGFHDGEVAAYIYRETTVLCILGILAGFALGIWLHAFVIQTAEVDNVMFGRDIYPLSYVFSAGLTLVFSVFVNIIMLKKLRGIDMVESMKANE